eukprot:12908770-Prorocentrum_lima.AAC.1
MAATHGESWSVGHVGTRSMWYTEHGSTHMVSHGDLGHVGIGRMWCCRLQSLPAFEDNTGLV